MEVVGTRVVPGIDWNDGNDDGGEVGTVTRGLGRDGWVKVKWPNGKEAIYRMERNGKHALQLADP